MKHMYGAAKWIRADGREMETETVEGWVEGIGRNCVPWKSAVRVMEVVVMMMMMMIVVVVVVVVMIVTMTKTMSVDNDSAYGKDYDDNDGDVNEKWLLLLFDCQSESRYMCKRVGLCIMLVHGLWLCISKTRNGVLDRF